MTTKPGKRGPQPERLKLKGNWEDLVSNALKKNDINPKKAGNAVKKTVPK